MTKTSLTLLECSLQKKPQKTFKLENSTVWIINPCDVITCNLSFIHKDVHTHTTIHMSISLTLSVQKLHSAQLYATHNCNVYYTFTDTSRTQSWALSIPFIPLAPSSSSQKCFYQDKLSIYLFMHPSVHLIFYFTSHWNSLVNPMQSTVLNYDFVLETNFYFVRSLIVKLHCYGSYAVVTAWMIEILSSESYNLKSPHTRSHILSLSFITNQTKSYRPDSVLTPSRMLQIWGCSEAAFSGQKNTSLFKVKRKKNNATGGFSPLER